MSEMTWCMEVYVGAPTGAWNKERFGNPVRQHMCETRQEAVEAAQKHLRGDPKLACIVFDMESGARVRIKP